MWEDKGNYETSTMGRLLVRKKIRRVTQAERAPMRSSPNCGTEVEKVSIGRAR